MQAAAHLLQIKQLLQIPLRVDRGYFSLRILVVHNARIETICQEDNRTSALLFSNQIRIQAGLLSGFGHIDTCALRLNHRQYATIITEQNIVCIPYLRFVGHSRDLIFIDPVLALNPSGITQHCINIDLARRILRYIERLGNIRLLLLLTASRQLLPQRFIFLNQLLQFDLCLRIHDQDRRLLLLVKELGVEFSLFIMVRIAIRHKIQEVKEILQTNARIIFCNLFARMRSLIAQLADQIQSLQEICVNNSAKVIGAEQADQLIVPGHAK